MSGAAVAPICYDALVQRERIEEPLDRGQARGATGEAVTDVSVRERRSPAPAR